MAGVLGRFKVSRKPITAQDVRKSNLMKDTGGSFRSKIALWKGDITRLEIDAIVNAANKTLLGGGGVDGAIHAAAGSGLLKECKSLNGCETGDAKITSGYKLPAKHVIHTVGPIGENESSLSNCYRNSLDVLTNNDLKTIAFPCISTGIYGYPNKEAARVALETSKKWLEDNHKKVALVIFCLFLPKDVEIYQELVDVYFPTDKMSEGTGEKLKNQNEGRNEKQISIDSSSANDNFNEKDRGVGNVGGEECEGTAVEKEKDKENKSGKASQNAETKFKASSSVDHKADEVCDNVKPSTVDKTCDKVSGPIASEVKNDSEAMDTASQSPSGVPMEQDESDDAILVNNHSKESGAIASEIKNGSEAMGTASQNQGGVPMEQDESGDAILVNNRSKESGDDAKEVKDAPEASAEVSKEQDDRHVAQTEEDPSELLSQCRLSPDETKEWIAKFKSFDAECIEKRIFEDSESWSSSLGFATLKYVGGLDISYHKTREDIACVSLVVLSFPEMKVIYHDTTVESVSVPYIPSYLAYREAEYYYKKIQNIKGEKFYPQVLLVDGNGALHPRKFGSAVKVGVDSDIPAIGVAKNLMVMQELGIERNENHKSQIDAMSGRGSTFSITTNNGDVLGKAVRTSDKSYKPVYVSIGHRCSLDTAVRLTLACSKTRIPEPIRQADHISKMGLRKIL